MDTTLAAMAVLLPLLYGALALLYGRLLGRAPPPGLRRAGTGLLLATILLHGGTLLAEGLRAGRPPLADRMELFSFVAFAVACSYLWVEWRRDNAATGVFPLSLAFLLEVASRLAGRGPAVTLEILDDPLFAWHALAAALALAALTVGAVYGALFLAMYRALKRGDLGPFTERMPSLDALAAMSLHAVEVGFAALTLAIGFGDLWIHGSPGMTARDPMVWATFAVWAVYGTALAGRFLARWGGWRVVSLNLAGYALLLGSMATVGRVIDTFHRFGGRP